MGFRLESRSLDETGKATRAALRYLTRRDRTEQEIQAYLREKGFSQKASDETLERLRSWRYVDDERLALSWACDRVERAHWGPVRVARELRRRGVRSEVIEEVLPRVMEDLSEESLASRAAERYLRTHPGVEDTRGMRRLAGFLGRRGFSKEAIGRVLSELWKK